MIKLNPHDLNTNHFNILSEIGEIDIINLCVEHVYKKFNDTHIPMYTIKGWWFSNNKPWGRIDDRKEIMGRVFHWALWRFRFGQR